VAVPIRDVVGKGGQVIRGSVLRFDESLSSVSLVSNLTKSRSVCRNRCLRDWRFPSVPACVPQNLCFGAEPLDVDDPPPLVLSPEEREELSRDTVVFQNTGSMSLTQIRYHRVPPHAHYSFANQRCLRTPAAGVLIEPSLADEHMQMAIEVQMTAERVRNNDDQALNTVTPLCPPLQHMRTKSWHVVHEDACSAETTARRRPA
jgi:hypothetical protein